MKLLVFGHWSHTGFGVVTDAIGSRLVNAGIDVRVLAVNHRGEPVRGPLAGRVWPYSYLEQHVVNLSATAINGELWTTLDRDDEWKPDAILSISDVSGILGYIGKAVAEWQSIPVFHYCPIEGDNLQPIWRQLWSMVQPVAMSDFGQRIISEHIGKEVPRIYHGVDTETFRPITPGRPLVFDGATLRTKDDCKAKFGIDSSRKVILRSDRNATRKRYDALFAAFVPIAQADPDVDLILHCQPIDPEGIDLWQEIMRMPEDLRVRVKFTKAHDTFKGLTPDGLNVLYNAADIYMTTTGGEGFGLTLAESMSAGVPVVSNAWAAEVEVVGPGGILIPPLLDSYGNPVRDHSRYGMDWGHPDPAAFVAPVLDLLSHPARRKDLGDTGRRHVVRSFSWDTAAAEFIALF